MSSIGVFSVSLAQSVSSSGRYLAVRILIQAVNIFSGFIIVRYLDPEQYAWFTIAISSMATTNSLANMGSASSVMSLGGNIWKNKNNLGELVSSAIALRRYLAIFALCITLPVTARLLSNNGSSFPTTLLLFLVSGNAGAKKASLRKPM